MNANQTKLTQLIRKVAHLTQYKSRTDAAHWHTHHKGRGHGACPHHHSHGNGHGRGHGKGFHQHHGAMNMHGLSMAKARILQVLVGRTLSQKEIAEILFIRPQSLTRIILSLQKDGLLQRRKDDDDKRALKVSLTTVGEERARLIEEFYTEHTDSVFDCLSDEEQATLIALLAKIDENN